MPVKKVQSEKLKVKSLTKKVSVKAGGLKVKTGGASSKRVRAVKVEAVAQKEVAKGVSVTVYNKSGKASGRVTLPGEIFNAKVNPVLMAQAVRVYLANQRAGGASTKTRGEVRGSTRKIYRQKGTGRARHGAIRAPIFVGGGIVFGPRHRDFSLKMPTKMKRRALFSALTQKAKENRVLVADGLSSFSGKTRETAQLLQALKVNAKNGKADKVLFVLPKNAENIARGARNVEGLEVEVASNLHTYEVLKNNYVLLEKNAIDVLKSTFLK